jgi:hypothetical protein
VGDGKNLPFTFLLLGLRKWTRIEIRQNCIIAGKHRELEEKRE